MLKILLWVVSRDGRFFNGALKILERQQNGVEVVGVTANVPIQLAKDGRTVDFIPLDKVDGGGDYDLLLVVGARGIGMSNITQAARQFRLPEEKLLGDWIVCIPGFTLDKYRRLQRSRLSIFSINCFGGFVSHLLGLPFRSPFINLWLENEDFIKFLRAPRVYLEYPPHFEKLYAEDQPYPVASLGNISLNMMHYKTFDEARDAWERRKTKINWYNLFVEMWTEKPEELEQFDEMPYGKKICFVPFKSDLDSAWYINPELDKTAGRIDGIVNNFVGGRIFYYDLFDMLLYGKKTPLF